MSFSQPSFPFFFPFDTAIALLIITCLLYAAVITITALCFVYYAGEGCGLSKFIVAFNLVLCILVTAASISPAVQERELDNRC